MKLIESRISIEERNEIIKSLNHQIIDIFRITRGEILNNQEFHTTKLFFGGEEYSNILYRR
jgi:hypothetical protein